MPESMTDIILRAAREIIALDGEPRTDEDCVIEACMDAIDVKAKDAREWVDSYRLHRDCGNNEAELARRIAVNIRKDISDIEAALLLMEDASSAV